MVITTAPEPATGEAYRGHAGRYDRRTEAFQQCRERLIALLPARPGDTVLDVGCGTGLCLPLLRDKVGPTGTIVGIDASEQMLRLARDRGHRPRLGQRPAACTRRPNTRRSTGSRTPPCSARCMTCCNPEQR